MLSLKRQRSTHGPPRSLKSRPSCTQDRSRPPETPPKMTQDPARTVQDGPKRPEIVPRCLQHPLSPPLPFFLCFVSCLLALFLFCLIMSLLQVLPLIRRTISVSFGDSKKYVWLKPQIKHTLAACSHVCIRTWHSIVRVDKPSTQQFEDTFTPDLTCDVSG